MPPTPASVRQYGGFRSIAPADPRPTSDPVDVVRWWKERLEKPLFVYVIQDGDDGAVKIGKAYNPVSRLSELQCGNPRTLGLRSAALVSDYTEEHLHAQWKRFNVRGEWFGSWVRPAGKPDRYGMGMVRVQPADHPNVQEAIIRLAREAQDHQVDGLLADTLHVERHRDTDRNRAYGRVPRLVRTESEQLEALADIALQTIRPPADWPVFETWPKVPQ